MLKYNVGERAEILYLESDPAGARVNSWTSLWFPSVVTGFMGVVFCMAGFQLINRHRKRQRGVDELKRTGIRIEARIQRIESDIEWDTGEMSTGQTLAVLVDRQDYKKHWVDTSCTVKAPRQEAPRKVGLNEKAKKVELSKT